MKFTGSINFVSERVYDLIWEAPPGTIITIKIMSDADQDHCEVEVV